MAKRKAKATILAPSDKSIAKHDRKLAILVHKNPDNDALGSAVLVKAWYVHERGYRPENIAISGSTDFGFLYKHFLDDEDLNNVLDTSWSEYEACIVDTPTPFFLERPQKAILKQAVEVTIYDHHMSDPESFRPYLKDEKMEIHYHCNPDMESCCEYIYGLISEDTRRKLTKSQLNACLLGMYGDSNGFISSTNSTMEIVRELITLGASVRCITNYVNKDIGIWGKLKYLAKLPQSVMWMKDSKVAIIRTTFSEWSECNHTIDATPSKNRTPLYLLSILHKERIRYCKTIHAYLLVYDREMFNNARRYVLVLDLIKWSPNRQAKLKELGFPVFRTKQTRYYFSACNSKYFGLCKDIDRVMTETHDDEDMEDIYDTINHLQSNT